MSRLTVFLARFIGLFTVLLMVGFLVRGSAMVETAVADGPVMLVYVLSGRRWMRRIGHFLSPAMLDAVQ